MPCFVAGSKRAWRAAARAALRNSASALPSSTLETRASATAPFSSTSTSSTTLAYWPLATDGGYMAGGVALGCGSSTPGPSMIRSPFFIGSSFSRRPRPSPASCIGITTSRSVEDGKGDGTEGLETAGVEGAGGVELGEDGLGTGCRIVEIGRATSELQSLAYLVC